ncbi:MAG: hypothetical protein DDT37_01736 [Firmicutes bacterium]|nr:hypothetical protein [candidate division NPL-UPA2 bacterium]
MITVVIVDSTIAGGRAVVSGEVVELSELEAGFLIQMGKAKLVEKTLAEPLAVRETAERKAPEKRHR